jgi:hypothetical protein
MQKPPRMVHSTLWGGTPRIGPNRGPTAPLPLHPDMVPPFGDLRRQLGCVIQTMQRRRQIARDWLLYERRRREAGDTGMTGLLYGLSLITSQHRSVTNLRISHRETRVRSGTDVARLDASKCQFITSDALTELRKMRAMSVNVVICSPPYWPLKRSYGGRGIGY